MKTKTKLCRLIMSLSLICLTIFFCILVFEGVLRALNYPATSSFLWVKDPVLGFKYASNLDRQLVSDEFDIRFRTSSIGLRDDEIGLKTGTRILLLGDSHTVGCGVERKKNFASLLEISLGAEVINAAVAGYELVHQLQYYRNYGKDLGADIVILMVNTGNDLAYNRNWRLENNNLVSADGRSPAAWASPIKLKILYMFIRYRLKVLLRKNEWYPNERYMELYRRDMSSDTRKDYEVAFDLIRDIRNEINRGVTQFFVTCYTYRTQIEERARKSLKKKVPSLNEIYDLDQSVRLLEEFLKKESVPYLNAYEGLRRTYEINGKPLFFFQDGHLNDKGHAAMARLIADYVKKRGLID